MEKYSFYTELKILGTNMSMDLLTPPTAGPLPIRSPAVHRKLPSNLWLIEPIKHERQMPVWERGEKLMIMWVEGNIVNSISKYK